MKKFMALLVVLALCLYLVPAAYSGSGGQATPTSAGEIKDASQAITTWFGWIYWWAWAQWMYFIWNNNQSWKVN